MTPPFTLIGLEEIKTTSYHRLIVVDTCVASHALTLLRLAPKYHNFSVIFNTFVIIISPAFDSFMQNIGEPFTPCYSVESATCFGSHDPRICNERDIDLNV